MAINDLLGIITINDKEYQLIEGELNQKYVIYPCPKCGIETAIELINNNFQAPTSCKSCNRKGKHPWNYGLHLTEEDKLNKSLAHKGIPHNAEWNRKVGEAQKGKFIPDEQRLKMSLSHIGKTLTQEQKDKIGEKSQINWNNSEFREKTINARLNSPIIHSKEYHDRFSEIQKKLNSNEEYKNSRIEATKAGYTDEVREQMSDTRKEMWKNPEYRDYTVRETLRATSMRPNIPELKLEALLKYACPNEYEYSGDGSIVINGLCPDFTNKNGQKKVIEMFGDFWHANPQVYKEDEVFYRIGRGKLTAKDIWTIDKERFSKFEEFGFKLLIIWESELEESNCDNVIEKIKIFNTKEKEVLVT